ncbi:MAG: WD40 repeat domain-containing protein [Pleurocapsa sp.]
MIANKLIFFNELAGHSEKINSICFSDNNKFLASASKDKTIKVWQMKSGKLANIIFFESDDVNLSEEKQKCIIKFDSGNKDLKLLI